VACYPDELNDLDNHKKTRLDQQHFVTEPAQDEYRDLEESEDESSVKNICKQIFD